MRNCISQLFVLFFLLSIQSICLHSQTADTFRFVNNTGRTVTDLHIEFVEEGVEMKNHNFPTVKGGGNITYRGPKRNGSDSRHDFQNGALPNKGIVTISFDSDTSDTQIKNWYWTIDNNPPETPYGEILNGTDENGKGQDPNLLGPGDPVSRLKLKHDVKNTRGKDQKVNDLHIVTTKRPSVLNNTRSKEGEEPKAGGVFAGDNVDTCDCDVVNAAKSAVAKRGIPKVCFEVCKGQSGTLYVLKLDTVAAYIPSDQEIELELKGLSPSDIAWHWWTYKGQPWRKPSARSTTHSKGEKGTGVKEEDGEENTPQPKEDWTTVASVFYLPAGSSGGAYFAIGATGSTSSSPFKPETNFAQHDMDQLTESIYNDPELFGKLFEQLNGEFFLGSFSEAPRFEDITTTNQSAYGLQFAYGFSQKVAVEAQINRFSAHASADFPVMVINEMNGETQSLLGQYEGSQEGFQANLGLHYLLGEGPLKAYAGAFIGLRNTKQTAQAQIAQTEWMVSQSKATNLGYGCKIGGRYLTTSGFFVDLGLQSANFGTSFQWGGQATIGFQF